MIKRQILVFLLPLVLGAFNWQPADLVVSAPTNFPDAVVIGLQLEYRIDRSLPSHLRKALRQNPGSYTPIFQLKKPWSVEIKGATDPAHTVRALIEVTGAKHCAIAYNDICLIKANRVDIQ